MNYAIFITSLFAIGVLSFLLGRRFKKESFSRSETHVVLLKSVRTIVELAILEFTASGVRDIKELNSGLFFARWKNGLLRYTAKLKVGFEVDRLNCKVDHQNKSIDINLPRPKILSCEIFNSKFYKMPLEKAENVRWKIDVLEEFTNNEVLEMQDIAIKDVKENMSKFNIIDLLEEKTKTAFRNLFSLSHPGYNIELYVEEKEQEKELPKQLPAD